MATEQPRQRNQLLLSSFILIFYFFFYPPGAATTVTSSGKAPGTQAGPSAAASTWTHRRELAATGSQPSPMLHCRLVAAGTARLGDGEEPQLRG